MILGYRWRSPGKGQFPGDCLSDLIHRRRFVTCEGCIDLLDQDAVLKLPYDTQDNFVFMGQ